MTTIQLPVPCVECVEHFFNYLESRHLSPATLTAYATDIEKFCQFLGLLGKTEEQAESLLLNASTEQVQAYFQSLRDAGIANATISRKRSTLASFYRYIFRTVQGLPNNPMPPISLPKQERRQPKTISKDVMAKILGMPNDRTLLGARDKCMLEMMYSTGIRVSELVGLKIENINATDRTLHIWRNGKERIVPLCQNTLATFEKYLELRNQIVNKKQHEDWLFLNHHRHRLSQRSVRRKMHACMEKAGIDQDFSPHTLRHSFATNLLQDGIDTDTVGKLLGYISIWTARIMYAR